MPVQQRNDTNGSFVLAPVLGNASEADGGVPAMAGDGTIATFIPYTAGTRVVELTASDGCSVAREAVVMRSTCPAKPEVSLVLRSNATGNPLTGDPVSVSWTGTVFEELLVDAVVTVSSGGHSG